MTTPDWAEPGPDSWFGGEFDGEPEGGVSGDAPGANFDTTTYLDGPVETTDIGRDSLTGLPGDVVQNGVTEWPPYRTDPVNPYQDDEHSEGIYKPPIFPNQDFPITDPRPA